MKYVNFSASNLAESETIPTNGNGNHNPVFNPEEKLKLLILPMHPVKELDREKQLGRKIGCWQQNVTQSAKRNLKNSGLLVVC